MPLIHGGCATYVTIALASVLTGYFVGAYSAQKSHNSKQEPDKDYEDEDEDVNDFGTGPHKMVFVVRGDLGMTKGKIAAQCAHAALDCYRVAVKHAPQSLMQWERYGQAKIALQCPKDGDAEDTLHTLRAIAQSLGLPAKIIHDAGRTQIAAGSATVLGIGPGPQNVVDQVTGSLKLL